MGENPTHRIEVGEPIDSLKEAMAWISSPPIELTLKKDYILTARYKDAALAEMLPDGTRHRLERCVAVGTVTRPSSTRKNAAILVCDVDGFRADGITVDDITSLKIPHDMVAFTKEKSCIRVMQAVQHASKTLLVAASYAIVLTLLDMTNDERGRPRLVLDTIDAWCRGELTAESLEIDNVIIDGYEASAGHHSATAAATAAASIAHAAMAICDPSGDTSPMDAVRGALHSVYNSFAGASTDNETNDQIARCLSKAIKDKKSKRTLRRHYSKRDRDARRLLHHPYCEIIRHEIPDERGDQDADGRWTDTSNTVRQTSGLSGRCHRVDQ